jgi:hypothetical protein
MQLQGVQCPLCGSWNCTDPSVTIARRSAGEICGSTARMGPNPDQCSPEHPCQGILVQDLPADREERTGTKESFLSLLQEVKKEATDLKSVGQQVVQHCQMANDISGPLFDFYHHIPSGQISTDDLTRQEQGWSAWLRSARRTRLLLTDVSTLGAFASSAMNTSISGVMMHVQSLPVSPSSPLPPDSEIILLSNNVTQVLDRIPLYDNIHAEIKRLKIDASYSAALSPTALLEQAKRSLEMPTFESGAMGALISLRECIERCFTELLRRLPKPEKAKGWKRKTELIGMQCGYVNLTETFFEGLGADGDKTNDFLSEAKQGLIDRLGVVAKFNKGMLFLHSLLVSIDETKLSQ